MSGQKQPNPDNRKNNVERLHDMMERTEAKLHEAEMSMEHVSPEERDRIKQKNEHRKQSIKAMKEEMKDEMNDRMKGDI